MANQSSGGKPPGKALPANPSLEFERKQAKALVRAFASSDLQARQRVRALLPDRQKLSLRDAQFVIAREYGFDGWPQLKDAFLSSTKDLDSTAHQARLAIAANDVAALADWLRRFPELKHWRDSDSGEVLLNATTSYANFPGAEDENLWNRPDCAALLLDHGAVLDSSVVLRIIDTGAHGMLALFQRRGLLPGNLRVAAALGDATAVAACFDANGRLNDRARPDSSLLAANESQGANWPHPDNDQLLVADAFLYACRLGHGALAGDLLHRYFALDAAFRPRLMAWQGEQAFIAFMLQHAPQAARFDLTSTSDRAPGPVWRSATEMRLHAALHEKDVDAISTLFRTEPFLLDRSSLDIQAQLLLVAAFSDGTLPIIETVISSGCAIAKIDRPPPSRAISYALEYGHADYVPLLSHIWQVPEDLAHSAGLGRLDQVKRWFDPTGAARLGALAQHDPFPDHAPTTSDQQVLDRALAWAVQNAEYAVADYLLAHGADINTRWSTHEPASILHECAAAGRLAQVKFLIDRGIDVNLKDYRFNSNAQGWAEYGGQREVAAFLASCSEG